jgi:hypothetical protein
MFVVRSWFWWVAVAACSAPPAPPAPRTAALPANPSATPTPPPPASGDELRAHVRAAYDALSSYQDTGDVYTNWADKPLPDELHFKLFYREPDRILLEWMDHHPYTPPGQPRAWRRNAVWSTGSGVRVVLQDAVDDSVADIATALWEAAGVSQRVSTNVPAQLVDGMRKPPARSLDGLLLLPPAVFEGVPCYRMKGHLDDTTFEIWVGQRDFLIRKIVETPPPGFLDDKLLWIEETHRDIRVNDVIADDIFEHFEAPRNCVGDPWCP